MSATPSHYATGDNSAHSLHRLDMPRCCDCKYYEQTKSQCRRYPPTFTGTMHDTVSPKVDFPEVLPTKDWCGEFSRHIEKAEAQCPGEKGKNATKPN